LCEINYEGVAIDTCPDCGGEWLDRDEVGAITHAREVRFSTEEIAQVKGVDAVTMTAEDDLERDLMCPSCNVPLKPFNFASTSGVILDKCPQCAGVWLDKDELEHVQILVEEWAKKLGEDQARLAPALGKMRQHSESMDRVSMSRFGFVNAMINGMLRIWD